MYWFYLTIPEEEIATLPNWQWVLLCGIAGALVAAVAAWVQKRHK